MTLATCGEGTRRAFAAVLALKLDFAQLVNSCERASLLFAAWKDDPAGSELLAVAGDRPTVPVREAVRNGRAGLEDRGVDLLFRRPVSAGFGAVDSANVHGLGCDLDGVGAHPFAARTQNLEPIADRSRRVHN